MEFAEHFVAVEFAGFFRGGRLVAVEGMRDFVAPEVAGDFVDLDVA